jgi:hypothetical protein
MQRLITSLILVPFLAGCFPQEGLRVQGNTAELQKRARPVFGRPISIGASSPVMIPFAIESVAETKFYSGGISSCGFLVSGSSGFGSGYSTYHGPAVQWNNVAFYDPLTGKARLLLDKPAVITRFDAPGEKSMIHGFFLLFAIATTDDNHDGIINGNDAVRLYRTDLRGEGMRAVSPEKTQLVDIDALADWLYLRVRRDSDGNGKFTDKDVIELLRVDRDAKEAPQLVLSDDLRRAAFEAATTRPAP